MWIGNANTQKYGVPQSMDFVKRIFGIPFNLLYISFGNPKIYSLDPELMRKLNTGVG